ncbi:recombinase family protein [Novosphingobium sediminicola]|uniref:DNA invertase Pin-like site-specific DNA recombinase n=1 Tax=Novosphingobium sediminicola TaxID=563162 RepID=A0A7W6CLB6_9SPHN|nr:recombinase family protein [Novosphingobium sediminicola]MBB3957887.1 DNA invertase Pin-like site-specific DNA recombinase [Novosphingobium sediminicola]
MLTKLSADGQVGTRHRAKLAYVYIRQSSPGQLLHHQESTMLQYRLVERALTLGWPRERVMIIDEDLGKSGATSHLRSGFQRLIAEVGLGHAGLVLSFDASRLARNNSDWHQLLHLCSMFGVLLADSERLYDPGLYHDRLLLGLSGIMSEAELHQIRVRQHQAERQKAARGELRMPLPAGLAAVPGGGIMLNPDAEVQARLNLVFERFAVFGSAKAVVRYLRQSNLTLPVRPLQGPSPHETLWRDANDARVRSILKNPAYAGAYVYGRRCAAPERRGPQSRNPTRAVPREEWEVCIRDAHPGYISWEEHMEISDRLADNVGNFRAGHRGAPRRGRGLLQGIAVCGTCGRRMALNYSGDRGDYPVYRCRSETALCAKQYCQEVRAPAVEAEIERLFLAALAPDQLELTLAALDEINAEVRSLDRQWALKRERAAYEVERARRQYDAVEPENRLVARSLEALWEDKLREAEKIEQDHDRWKAGQIETLDDDDRSRITDMGIDLPGLWENLGNADRKAMLRLVVDQVVLDQRRVTGMVWIRVIWQTGATTERWIRRRTASYTEAAQIPLIEQRVRELNSAGMMDAQIATTLNAEGLANCRGEAFTNQTIHLLRQRWKIKTVKINGATDNPSRWPDGSYSIQGAASELGITPQTIFKWLKKGRLQGRQLTKGQPWQIDLTNDQIAQFRVTTPRISPSRRKVS